MHKMIGRNTCAIASPFFILFFIYLFLIFLIICLHYFLWIMTVAIIRDWKTSLVANLPQLFAVFAWFGDRSFLLHLGDMLWHQINWAEVNCGFGNLLEWISEMLFTSVLQRTQRVYCHLFNLSGFLNRWTERCRVRIRMKPSSWHQIKQVGAQQAISSISQHQNFQRYHIWQSPCIKHKLSA